MKSMGHLLACRHWMCNWTEQLNDRDAFAPIQIAEILKYDGNWHACLKEPPRSANH